MVVVLLWLAHTCPSSNKLISTKQRKKTPLNLDDSTTYYFTSHVAWLSRWADSCTIFVVVVDLITHTQKEIALLSWNCMDCCKFLVLNDLRNSCPGIVGIVASFLSWLIWGIHVVMIVVLLHVFHCYFVLCSIGTVLGFTSGIIDGIIYLPLTR